MIKLSPRLSCAVPYVRSGRLLADVGTDHAYLPIYLCQAGILTPVTAGNGQVICAVASDINKGPVKRAELHIAAEGLTSKITTLCTDGLHGLDSFAPEDIVIFGMGGELILSILEDAPWIQARDVRLILQPMTHPEKLRMGLAALGFEITGETLCAEGERMYQIICADYSPNTATPPKSPAEALTGSLYPPELAMLHRELIQKVLAKEIACRNARDKAGQDTRAEDRVIASLKTQYESITKALEDNT